MKQYFAYILSNKNNTVLYTGVTNNLLVRVWQHKNKVYKGFTSKYNINKLVYYEIFEDAYEAISREKQIKNLLRIKKEALINKDNPDWEDLYEKL